MAESLPVEAGPRPSSWVLAGQFFLIPLGIVTVCASVYGLAVFLAGAETTTPTEWVRMVRESGKHGREYAAHQLAVALQRDAEAARQPGLADRILDALDQVSKDGVLVGQELSRIQCALVLCVGLTRDRGAVSRLAEVIDATTDDVVKSYCMDAMGAIQDPRAGERLVPFLDDRSALLRKCAVFNLAALRDPSRLDAIRAKLGPDEDVDVRWNAAIGLAIFHGDASGLDVVRGMLDSETMARCTRNDQDPEQAKRNQEHAMRMACVAAGALKDSSLGAPLEALSKDMSVDLSVREAAREVLRGLGGAD